MARWSPLEHAPDSGLVPNLPLTRTEQAPRRREAPVIDPVLAAGSYEGYFRAMHPFWKPSRIQCEVIFPAIDELVEGKIDRLILNQPPRHGKTEGITKPLPGYFMGRFPSDDDKNVIVIACKQPLAQRFGRSTRDMLNDAKHLTVFPECALVEGNSSAVEFEVYGGNKYYAFGFGSTIIGVGAGLILIDDPVKSMIEALSEAINNQIQSTYTGVIETRLEPGCRMMINMTRWTNGDLSGWRMVQDGAVDYFTKEPIKINGEAVDIEGKTHPWHVISLPFIAEEDEPHTKRIKGEILWPERFTDPRDVRRILNLEATIFGSEYQQHPIVGGGNWFRRDQINFYNYSKMILEGGWRQLNRYLMCDPAVSEEKKKKNDRNALLSFGAGSDRNYYILEFIRERFDPTVRFNHLFRMHRRWQPLKVGYEEYGLSCDIHFFREKMERENYRFSITKLGGQIKKETRIELRLKELGQHARLWFPDPYDTTNTPEDVRKWVLAFINSEWVPAPNYTHDDGLDILSRMLDEEMGVVFPAPPVEEEDEYERGSGRSWMSS